MIKTHKEIFNLVWIHQHFILIIKSNRFQLILNTIFYFDCKRNTFYAILFLRSHNLQRVDN